MSGVPNPLVAPLVDPGPTAKDRKIRRPLKIMHVLNHAYALNGHVELTVDLACDQANAGHDVWLATGGCNFDELLSLHGVKRFRLDHIQDKKHFIGNALKLAHFTRKSNIDIVHAHMVASALVARAAKVFGHFKLVTSVHNPFDPQSIMMRVGQRVIAVSEMTRCEMETKGIPPARLRTVLNGTLDGWRRQKGPLKLASLQSPAIVAVGGLHRRKGLPFLIDAFAKVAARHQNAHLYIVGVGPDLAALMDQSGATGYGERIQFLGAMDDPREILGAADVFVLPSLAESFGLVVTEAREMGCAVIAAAVGGVPEAVDGKGVLVTPGDSTALAEAIDRLLSDSAALAHYRNIARSGLEKFSVRRMTFETELVYEDLLG